MTDRLPTARTMAPIGFQIHVWCKACRHSGNADLDALIRSDKGDIPFVRLRWQCELSPRNDGLRGDRRALWAGEPRRSGQDRFVTWWPA